MDSQRQVGYIQLESNDAVVSWCTWQDNIPWYSKPNLRRLYILMFLTCLTAEMTVGYDMSMVNGMQAVSSWLEYFHHPRSALLGFMVAVYSLGFIAAVPFVPIVVDKLGRRYPILLAGTISTIGCIMQGSALNYTMLVIARFTVGFANVFSIVAACSLIAELSHPKERAVMNSLFYSAYDIGAVTSAGLILGTFTMTNNWGWRIPSLLQAVPSLLQVSFIWLLPESPRWLVSRGRRTEAYAILVKYHAEGDENSDFARVEYTQIGQALKAEQKSSETNWMELFSTPGIRKRTTIAIFLAFSVQWSGAGLTTYFLSPILDSIGIHDNRTKNIMNLARISWSLVNGTVYAFIAPRYPRRRMFLTFAISLFLVFTAWTIAGAEYSLAHNKVSAQAVLVLIFLNTTAYNGFTALIPTFLIELFPFHVRAKGISLYQWWLRIAGFVTQVMDPIGIDAAGWKWYIVYCVWNAFQVVFVYLMFPETSGCTLEELTFLYETEQEEFSRNELEPLCERINGQS